MSDYAWIAIAFALAFGALVASHCYKEVEMARAGMVQKQNDKGSILWVKP